MIGPFASAWLRETTGRARLPYSCPPWSGEGTGVQRGALGVVWWRGEPVDNLHLIMDSCSCAAPAHRQAWLLTGRQKDGPMEFTSHSGLDPIHFEKMPKTMEYLKPEGGMRASFWAKIPSVTRLTPLCTVLTLPTVPIYPRECILGSFSAMIRASNEVFGGDFF